MKGIKVFILAICMVFALASLAVTEEFKVYPGARLDEMLTKDAAEMAAKAKLAMKPSIYVTDDSFEKVLAFYKGIGEEYQTPLQKEGSCRFCRQEKNLERLLLFLTGRTPFGVPGSGQKSRDPISGKKWKRALI